jgi:hypothetical protein
MVQLNKTTSNHEKLCIRIFNWLTFGLELQLDRIISCESLWNNFGNNSRCRLHSYISMEADLITNALADDEVGPE